MNNKPFISIVVPVKDFERTISKSLGYLLQINYPHDFMEIVIVDGGSRDRTPDIIRSRQKDYSFIKLIEAPDCASAGFARNKALESAKGEYIFFTDGDCAPCKEWVNIMLSKFASDAAIGIVGGEIHTLKVDTENLTEAYCEHFRFNMVSPRYGFIKEGYFPALTDRSPTQIAGHRAYFFVTANVAYRRKAIRSADAKFWQYPTGEDMDMCLQVESKGWRLYFAPDAYVHHMHRSDIEALRKVWFSYAFIHPVLIAKYARNRFELVLQFMGQYPKNPVISFPSPVKGFLYLGHFQLMHIFVFFVFAGAIGLIMYPENSGIALFALTSFILGVYSAVRFFYWSWFMKPRKHFFTWCKMRYLTNLSFLAGGLEGSQKHKAFCIEPSF